MTMKPFFVASLLALLLAGTVASAQTPRHMNEQTARAIAQKHVPNSALESADLEKEGGRLFWSIDLRPNGSNNIIEIHVDAYSGEVIKTETETPSQQRAEKTQDARDRKSP